MSVDFAAVLTKMVEVRASDVHLTPGFPPALRVRGRIVPITPSDGSREGLTTYMGVNPTLEGPDDRGGSELALGLLYLRPGLFAASFPIRTAGRAR